MRHPIRHHMQLDEDPVPVGNDVVDHHEQHLHGLDRALLVIFVDIGIDREATLVKLPHEVLGAGTIQSSTLVAFSLIHKK